MSPFHVSSPPHVAVVIPCFKVSRHILAVLNKVGPDAHKIYVVDDACPEGTGRIVQRQCVDPRVVTLFHDRNQGVGGAVMTGYRAAIADGATVIVKLDGDTQMDPALIPFFIAPILAGGADYTKGNRFFDPEDLCSMPWVRLVGNAVLSFMAKLSTGYWDLFDPTNGYTAIHARMAMRLPFDKISRRFFFETDLLFRLSTFRAVVEDVPMDAHYGEEVSNLKISSVLLEFFLKHVRNTFKRIFYNYYLRDLSLASFELPLGVCLILFGFGFGVYRWWVSARAGVSTSAGTVMLSALPVLLGLQFLLAFIGFDISSVPRRPRQQR